MKKLLGALCACAIPGLAMGQSSLGTAPADTNSYVQLYGLLDIGMSYTTRAQSGANSGQVLAVTSSVLQPNRWGLRGSEDLGGGLRAIFTLESGFFLENGAASQGLAFSRNATVGLAGNWGEVRLGRQFDFMYDLGFYSGIVNVSGGMAGSAHTYGVDNRLDGVKVNNSIRYLGHFGGFNIGAMYALGGVPGQPTAKDAQSFSLGYTNTKFSVDAVYTNDHNPEFSPLLSPWLAHASGVKSAGVGAYFNVDEKTRLFALYTYSRAESLANKSNLYTAGASYLITPALSVGADYTLVYTRDSANNKGRLQEGDVGLDYSLSKRTDVYTGFTYQRVTGANTIAFAFPATNTASSGNTQGVFRIGMRHRF
ncbi:porin [Paraburkholderia strydomiana]|jgi:predicted porin|uniref:Porin n=1 Tax=Paraburkholderia strydomiana TaxID=1245417 RepID=A0ABW9EK29_9BURK